MGFFGDLIPDGLEHWFFPTFSLFRLMGMAFVLGNFFTATADDLDHMSSTRGFLKTWSMIVIVVLCIDIADLFWDGYDMQKDIIPFIVKWILLMVFCTLSYQSIGVIFKLATGDVVAIASAGALLSPLLVVLFFIVLKVVDFCERPILRRFGSGGAYPFMPVVFTAFLLMILLAVWMSGALGV